jgi:UDP-N-acetylmuramoyl-tripeptide--D-alanyl-D-alanine ligase
MRKPLSWVVEKLGLQSEAQGQITGWSIDSRTLRPGDLFFALHGPNHDGHAYVADVFGKGAAAAVVDREIANPPGPVLRVSDTTEALQKLAYFARAEWGGDIIAVTGSAGKTTTKEVIATMLAELIETS